MATRTSPCRDSNLAFGLTAGLRVGLRSCGGDPWQFSRIQEHLGNSFSRVLKGVEYQDHILETSACGDAARWISQILHTFLGLNIIRTANLLNGPAAQRGGNGVCVKPLVITSGRRRLLYPQHSLYLFNQKYTKNPFPLIGARPVKSYV
jgi:hypothetical protein